MLLNETNRKMGSESNTLERTVISTYGSFIADSLIEWTKVWFIKINIYIKIIILLSECKDSLY